MPYLYDQLSTLYETQSAEWSEQDYRRALNRRLDELHHRTDQYDSEPLRNPHLSDKPALTRAQMEDAALRMPRVRDDYQLRDRVPYLTDEELWQVLNAKIIEKRIKQLNDPPRTWRKIKPPKTERVCYSFADVEGQLVRRDVWHQYKPRSNEYERPRVSNCDVIEYVRDVPVLSKTVIIDDDCTYPEYCLQGKHVVSSSLVLHAVKTGRWVSRVPRGVAKPFKAAVRVGKVVKHLGYFPTQYERDAAVLSYKLTQSHSDNSPI